MRFKNRILFVVVVSIVSAENVQDQYREFMEIASPSCQGVISMCENPFIGMDVRAECAGVTFSQTCRHAGCAAELCNLFEIGIDKCQKLCELGPLSDDCQKCPYLPIFEEILEEREMNELSASEIIDGMAFGRAKGRKKSIIEAINSLPSKKKKKEKKSKKSKKSKMKKQQSPKPLLYK
ncbi:unnamed protein product [Oikopleura dioica]|uniref:Uncharacterized protein n=1 Tax=Oikopleura dioica TaxID=34765 RepID=E4Y9E9_OIKDI|nr:unnamed protein product [Oikopleura dioica]